MDVSVEFAGIEIGSMPYESIPAFFLLLRENGLPFKWDMNNSKIQLQQGLEGKTILLGGDTINKHHSAESFKQELIDGIQIFLKSCGASVLGKENQQPNNRIDLRIVLALNEDPAIYKPKLEVLYDMKVINQKWPFVLQEECREAGIQFASNVNSAETEPYIKFLMKVPSSEPFNLQKKLIEQFQMIISMGILARLKSNYPLFALSCLPMHKISFLQPPAFNTNMVKNIGERKLEKTVSKSFESSISKQRSIVSRDYLPVINKKMDVQNSNAEVFFDYQLIIDRTRNEKILLFGNLFIKNTGETSLRNPVICFRMSPKGKINFSGQLVPPNVVETLGVLNSEKGWKYINDDWFQQAEEKGEIWVCPIKSLEISSGQTEAFQNFRINLVREEDQRNFKVEGFVYFKEQNLEYKANNSISISF